MSIRRLILCLFALALLLGLAIGISFISSSQRLTRARLERVEKGMSRQQVIRTVGRPPGDYTSHVCVSFGDKLRLWGYESWLCNDGELLVHFDQQGIATRVVVYNVFDL